MGLDNGFRIKNKRKADIKVPWFVDKRLWYDYDPSEDEDGQPSVEIIYWRKCWGIRNAIMNKLHFEDNSTSNDRFSIQFEDIPAICRILTRFMDKQYYEENADSIWDYEDFSERLSDSILTLLWLGQFMQENPGVEVYFYDSY